MVFNWLLTPQIHKYTSGYYLNHDNLIIANKEDRQKLIFYFIASQTPEKLDPADHHLFNAEKYIDVEIRAFSMAALAGIYTFTKLGSMSFISSKIFRRPLLNASLYATAAFLSISFSYNLGQMLFEPTFVSDNKVIAELAAKYQFSVFDFALAKKESHFKQLVNELVSDSAGISSY